MRRAIAAGALALVAAVSVAAAPAFGAEPSEANGEGYWYHDWLGFPEIHARGIDGSGVTVAVIDLAINPDVSFLADADVTVQEPSVCADADMVPVAATSTDAALASHGTNVVGFLVGDGAGPRGVAPGASVLYYSAAGDTTDAEAGGDGGVCNDVDMTLDAPSSHSRAIDLAVAAGADIITISLAGDASSTPGDLRAVADAQRAGVIVVAGVANFDDADDSLITYPSGLNGVVAVGAIDPEGVAPTTMWNPTGEVPTLEIRAPGVDMMTLGTAGGWDQATLGSGTSFATPVVAGALALAMQEYPDATSNQLLQALARTTFGNASQELARDPDDVMGYGILDPVALLATDPTELPDENPFLTDGPDEIPTRAEVLAAPAEPQPATTATDPGTDEAPGAEPSSGARPEVASTPAWVLPVVIAVGLGLAGGTVAAVVIAVRASRKERIDA